MTPFPRSSFLSDKVTVTPGDLGGHQVQDKAVASSTLVEGAHVDITEISGSEIAPALQRTSLSWTWSADRYHPLISYSSYITAWELFGRTTIDDSAESGNYG